MSLTSDRALTLLKQAVVSLDSRLCEEIAVTREYISAVAEWGPSSDSEVRQSSTAEICQCVSLS